MSRPVRLATLLIAAALACTTPFLVTHLVSQHAASHETALTRSAPVAASGATGGNVCTGVRGCTVVAEVDVDGDGRADQVGVSSSRPADGGTITVRVRTASQHTLQTVGRDVYWFSRPFLGATPIDGRAGAEIVVGSTMGANYEQFRVITYRKGKLVTLKAPPTVGSKSGMQTSTARWGIDGAYSFNAGVYRHVSDGHVTVTIKTAIRNDSGRGFTGHTSSYRWHGGHWKQSSSTKVRYTTDASVTGLGGWHVSGLPAFPK